MWLLISLFLMFPVNILNERAVVRGRLEQQDQIPSTVHNTVEEHAFLGGCVSQ